MVTPFLGQLMAVGFNFAPRGWSFCDGQVLPIAQNTALFSLLGTTFGGDGRTTFALPDLRSRYPRHVGTGPGLDVVTWGERGGTNQRTLVTANLPSHNHTIGANTGAATTSSPTNAYMATAEDQNRNGINLYSTTQAGNMASTGNTGSNTAVDILDPYLGIYWCIALTGTFPSRN